VQTLRLLLVQGISVSYRIKAWGKLRRSFKKNKTLERTDVSYLFIVFEFLTLLVVNSLQRTGLAHACGWFFIFGVFLLCTAGCCGGCLVGIPSSHCSLNYLLQDLMYSLVLYT